MSERTPIRSSSINLLNNSRAKRRFALQLIGIVLCSVWFVLISGCNDQTPQTPIGSANAAEKHGGAKEKDSKASHDHAGSGKANRLARETSPYLLLHAHNPVDWYPWGAEAFEKAKKENKLIFLSIGYSSCYWCHVMEREVFSNKEIAEFMNKNFVNIKVDREERPDIDDIYMTALHIYLQLSGSNQGGGWPLSIFLTPEGKPIAGGTYFPPEEKPGLTSFPTVMNRIQTLWTDQKESVVKTADTITGHLRRTMKPRLSLTAVEVNQTLVKNAVGELLDSFDSVYGGVDFDERAPNRPKFPVPAKLALLQHAASKGDQEAQKVLKLTLDNIAAGGIRDHLAGGFHRYSTDRAWMVPHFEKMLYDNAQLLDVYTSEFERTKSLVYKDVIDSIARYVADEMTGKQGAFFSAQDAETDAIEGKFYVWESDEVAKHLGEDAELFQAVYGFKEQKYFEHGFILHLPKPVEEVAKSRGVDVDQLKQKLATIRTKLLLERRRRKAPLLDDKILTSWNGLMIRGLANAGSILDNDDYIVAAERAADFVMASMRDDKGRLLRTYRVETAKLNAYLDDYAFLVEGMLALHQATGKDKWLVQAKTLTDDQIKLFWDEKGDGFYYTSHHHEELLARTKNAYDSVLPSGNSVSVRNLMRLSERTGDASYRVRAKKILELFTAPMKSSPRSMVNMALATAEFLESEPNARIPVEENDGASAKSSLKDSNILPASASSGDKTKKKPELVTAKVFLSGDKLTTIGRTRIAVALSIKPGWHINTNPAQPDFLVPTSVKIKSRYGTKLSNVRFPKGHAIRIPNIDEDVMVHEGTLKIFGELEAPESAISKKEVLEIEIRYQACNDQQCMRPKTIKLNGKITVAAPGESIRSINSKHFQKRAVPDREANSTGKVGAKAGSVND